MNHTSKRSTFLLSFLCICLFASLGLGGCSMSDGQTFAWPLATASPEDTVTQLYAEKFAEMVDYFSDGEMKIEVYANSTLGGDRDLLESCADGDIPFVVQNTAPQVAFMNDLAVFDLPCVFDSLDDLRETLDQYEFASALRAVYDKGGYTLLGIADQGFRVMSTNKAVHTADDFKGQKIRTMENPYHLRFWQSIQAAPTPMSFAEVYIGLQQHTIDAQENPYEVIVSNRLFEQQDYVVETNHLPHLITLICSKKFEEKLTYEQRMILQKAAAIATVYARDMSDERICDRIAQIEESGTQIIELDEATRESIRESAQPLVKDIQSQIDPTLFYLYTAGSEK